MFRKFLATIVAACICLSGAPARAGDYDQALTVISRAFPEVRSVGVFYEQSDVLVNLLEFESSAFKEFGLGIKLIPLDPKKRITAIDIRTLCIRNEIQAILLLDGDPVVKPGSLAGNAIVAQGSRIPIVGIIPDWLHSGAWFVVGPKTKGLQIDPKGRDPQTLEALKKAGEDLLKAAP